MTNHENTVHEFDDVHADIPSVCKCGAMFVEGYHLNVVKAAHLEAFGVTVPAPPVAVDLANLIHLRHELRAMNDADLSDLVEGRTRLGNDRTLDLLIWNLAMDEENDR